MLFPMSLVCAIFRSAAIAGLWLTGCAVAPIGPQPAPAWLELDNPHSYEIQLDAVVGDQCTPLRQLGRAPTTRLALWPGCYVVRVRTAAGCWALPAPLCDVVLPADRCLRLSLANLPTTFGPDDDAEFALVPAGPALIGDPLGVGQEDERPARLVDVPAFWIGRREVTNGDYAAFLNAVGRAPDPAWAAFDSRKCRLQRGAEGRWLSDAPDLPMVTVSLAGALAYCEWRTQQAGVRHRLPSEVEWEKAARGPASFVYDYGNCYRRAAANQESGTLRAVGQHPATGFGTQDLTGNAFEWTQDVYPTALPGTFQVLRGGSFVLDGMYLRSSFRMRQRPETRTDDFGFRVVREAAAALGPSPTHNP